MSSVVVEREVCGSCGSDDPAEIQVIADEWGPLCDECAYWLRCEGNVLTSGGEPIEWDDE